MKNKNESTTAPVLRLSDLAEPKSEVARRIHSLANNVNKMARNNRSSRLPDSWHQLQVTALNAAMTQNYQIPQPIIAPSGIHAQDNQVAERPPTAPVRPDEPLAPCYYVFKNGCELWPENPSIEIQFRQSVPNPAFP